MIKALILTTRSYRRFYQEQRLPLETLREFIDTARLSGSAANLQPLKFLLFNKPADCSRIFPTLGWAGYLKDWEGPEEGERPSAYIIILGDRKLSNWLEYDAGIVCQTILLAATEKDLGGCMLGSVNRDKLKEELAIDEKYELLLVLALGKPSEKVIIEDVEEGGSIKYWRDKDDVHHVPKRKLDDLILN